MNFIKKYELYWRLVRIGIVKFEFFTSCSFKLVFPVKKLFFPLTSHVIVTIQFFSYLGSDMSHASDSHISPITYKISD